jgi:hypothetical protein
MPVELGDGRVAVYLDVENLCIHAMQQGLDFDVNLIIARARTEGRMVVARAYGDFTRPYLQSTKRDLMKAGVEMALLSTDAKGKNTADMQLALDAMEMALLPAGPDVVIVGSGDRDYVPLVQKLKRYTKQLIGIGLKGSISGSLARLCDAYWYYDDLLPRADEASDAAESSEPEAPAVMDEMDRARETLLRALESVANQGLTCTGANTAQMMRRIQPTFEAKNLGFRTFKGFVEAAEEHGIVRIAGMQGMDVVIEALAPVPSNSGAATPADQRKQAAPAASAATLAQYYRGVLQNKRVPMVPWVDRERLVRALWAEIEGRDDAGLTVMQMTDAMALYADMNGIQVSRPALQKITYTLNIGRCFKRAGIQSFIEDITTDQAGVACDADEALDRMHVTYLRGIRIDAPGTRFTPEASALLLFDTPTEAQVDLAASYILQAETWGNY